MHGLDISASSFRAEEDFYLDAFLKHSWYSGNTKRDKNSFLQAWNAFVLNVQQGGREAWLKNLNTDRVRSEKRTLQVKKLGCIICLVRQEFYASRGATHVRVVSTTLSALKGRYTPFLRWGRAHIFTEMCGEVRSRKIMDRETIRTKGQEHTFREKVPRRRSHESGQTLGEEGPLETIKEKTID